MDRFLEDLSVGDSFETPTIPVSEEDVLEFARRYDPQPMHTDHDTAKQGAFQGLIASGWHTAALVMKLTAEARVLGNTPLLGMGIDSLAWPFPVRPGDTLRAVTEVTAIRPSRSKPNFGIVSFDTTAYNQHGQVVFSSKPKCWVPRRPA